MRKVLKKLVLGKNYQKGDTPSGNLNKRIKSIKAIWNNDHQDDVGIEKLFRLFLAASQFLFPGIYIKHIFGRWGTQVQDVAMDFYIIFKVALPLFFLYYGYLGSFPLLLLIVWLMLETILYVPLLMFASDGIASPSSYRRSMLLLFLNYLELIFAFALLYSFGNYLNKRFEQWYDAIYFSFTTMTTIGFGDYFPITGMGKLLVCFQSLLFLAFVVLFINYFSNRVENKGYFDSKK